MAGQSNPPSSVTSSISNVSLSSSDSSSSASGSARSTARKSDNSIAPPPLRRANSLSSMHVKDCVSTPNDRTIDKVAARVHSILCDHNRAARTDLRSFSQFEPNVRQVFALARVGLLQTTSRDPLDHPVPPAQLIADFIADLAAKSQLEKGCVVVALVYLERLMQTARLRVTSLNWRHVVFATILMASKVWDDVSMWNVDFASVSQFFSLRQANEMEALILDLLNWNVILSPAEYAATFLSLFDSAHDLATSGVSLSDITVSAHELAAAAPSLPVLSPELSSDPFGSLAPPALSRGRTCGDEFHQALQPLALSA